MPRWRQVINKETGKSEFVPIGDRKSVNAHAIHANFEPFTSPIDGTVISGRKAYREHMEKHGVVPAAEFSDEFYASKQKERDRLLRGDTPRQRQERGEEIDRIIDHHININR